MCAVRRLGNFTAISSVDERVECEINMHRYTGEDVLLNFRFLVSCDWLVMKREAEGDGRTVAVSAGAHL